jgi:hypothetical protein
MGRLDVRTAIQAAIQGAGIDYVGTVYPARPIIAEESAYAQTMSGQAITASVNGSAAILVVNIPTDDRTRYADVGRSTVADFNKHLIALEIWFACTSGDGVASQQDYDTVVDGLTEFIRENPNMSAPSTVWSAGEYRYGVKHQQEEPYTSDDGLTVLISGVIKFEAWEQINGPIPQPPD